MDLCTTCLQLYIVFNLSGLDNSFMFLEGRSTSKVPRLIPDICYPHLIGGFSSGFIQRDSSFSVGPMEQVGAGGGRQGSSWAWVAGAGCGGAGPSTPPSPRCSRSPTPSATTERPRKSRSSFPSLPTPTDEGRRRRA